METQPELKSSLPLLLKNALVVVACCLVAWYLCQHIKVTLTNSLSKRVFWAVKDQEKTRAIKTGMYIIFDQYVPKPESRVLTFIKKVGCSRGEHLKFDSESYFCNEKYIGHAKRKSLKGEPLTPFIFNGRIPEGMFFAVGDHPYSFDSRYVGLISRHRVKEVAWSIF